MGSFCERYFVEATFCLEHAEIWKGMVINMGTEHITIRKQSNI